MHTHKRPRAYPSAACSQGRSPLLFVDCHLKQSLWLFLFLPLHNLENAVSDSGKELVMNGFL